MRAPNGEQLHVIGERRLAEIVAVTAADTLSEMAERAYDEARACQGGSAERSAEGLGHALRGQTLEGAADVFRRTVPIS